MGFRKHLIGAAFCVFAVGASFPLAPSALASESPIPLATAEFPPYNYSHDGKIVGSSADIIRAVFKRMGRQVSIKILPPKRAMWKSAEGEFAGYFTFTKNDQRLRDYYYSPALATIADVFFKKQDRDISWASLDDLKLYTVGATKGYNYAPEFLKAIEEGRFKVEYIVSETPEFNHLRKLAFDRVDLAICEVTLCNHLIKKHKKEFSGLDYIDRAIGPVRTFHLGLSKKWPESNALAQEFEAAFDALLNEGVITQIHKKHGTRRDVTEEMR